MGSPQRSKAWGYEVEVQAVNALEPIFHNVRRTGSMAYKKAAADLVSDAQASKPEDPVLIVVTKDKGPGNPLLVTLSVADLRRMVEKNPRMWLPVRVQCKGRKATWVGKLWRELRDAVKAEKGAGA